MKILAIDTTTSFCSVALFNKGEVSSSFEECFRNHNQKVLNLIKLTLDQSSVSLKELDALAFSRGPGSFTGTRIGVGVAQGLALGANLPMISISTLAILAQRAWNNLGATKVLTTIDAQMGEIYWAEYIRDKKGNWHGEKNEIIITIEAVNERLQKLSGQWTGVGDGWQIFLKMFDITKHNISLKDGIISSPTAKDMLPIACQFLTLGKILNVEKAKPVYLRNKIVKS